MSIKPLLLLLLTFPLHALADLSGRITVSKNNYAIFKIKEIKGQYLLELKPNLAKSSCDYKIRKITAPAKIKGEKGIIQADKLKCSFEIEKLKPNLFWNSIVLVDMTYYFKTSTNLSGEVSLSSLKANHRFKIDLKLSK
jgi:hypothetical protein